MAASWLVLPRNQEWPESLDGGVTFATVRKVGNTPIPPYCSYQVGGIPSHGYGSRVLFVSTRGAKLEDGIDAALAVAEARGLGPVKRADSRKELDRVHDDLDYPEGRPSWLHRVEDLT